MNKHGFTLMELLVVVAIVAVVGVASSIAFTNIQSGTEEEELKNKYVEIQRAANLYLDLHNSDIEWFLEDNIIYYKIGDLKAENYIGSDLSNPVTGENIDSNYFVKIYVSGNLEDEKQLVSSCIIDRNIDGDICIADNLGNSGEDVVCCE